MNLLGNPVAVMFLSFLLGMLGNALLRRLAIYKSFGDRYLFTGAKPYENLGVLWYRRFLLATPFKWFNTSIRFSANRSLEKFDVVLGHMIDAEVAHWIGFAGMLVFSIAAFWYRGLEMASAHLILNLLGNLYPCLLQQYNRQRLNRVINSVKRRSDNSA